MNKKRKQIIESSEISEVCEVTLGGYKQKIMLDGKSKSNPVVICLHGGPGTPIPFSVGCRGMFPDITDKVTLVCWDQLGCGINNFPIDNSFDILDFVYMTVDLIKEVHRRFPENKLYLFGMSWGSILSVKAANMTADILDGVITYGQVLCNMTFNDEVFSVLENSALPESKKEKLHTMKNDRSIENAKTIMAWIKKYTEGYTCKAEKSSSITDAVIGLMTSPDYKFRDFKAVIINGYMKNTSLLNQLTEIDLRDDFSRITIPYTIIQGSTDIVTSTLEVKNFLIDNNPNNIKLIIAENNGHIPNKKAMEIVFNQLISL